MVEAGDDDDGLLHLRATSAEGLETLLHAPPGTVAVSATIADRTSRGERQPDIGGDDAVAVTGDVAVAGAPSRGPLFVRPGVPTMAT